MPKGRKSEYATKTDLNRLQKEVDEMILLNVKDLNRLQKEVDDNWFKGSSYSIKNRSMIDKLGIKNQAKKFRR